MLSTLTLHCGIPNCKIHYEYQFSDAVSGLMAHWYSHSSDNIPAKVLLADFPNVGNSYIIELCFPVKLNLSTPFWALYMNPTAATEGLDSEAGIQSLRFCLCKAKSIISQNEKDARLEVEVSEVKSLTSLIGSAPGTAARVPDIIKDTAAGYGSIEHFENYCLVRVDFQGDCGTQSIFWKNNGRSYLVAENDWDFHRDTWELLNEPLSREQELTLGISHSP